MPTRAFFVVGIFYAEGRTHDRADPLIALILAALAPPPTSAYLSLGTSELAYDGQDATTATASIYATAPMTITVALDAAPALLIDRAPRAVFVAPDQPATLVWRVALDQSDPVPDRRPLPLRLIVDGAVRAEAPVRAWLVGVARPGWAVYLPMVR